MRKIITTLVFASVLTACGTVAASTRTASGPVVEDRSYDRIEELRAARSTTTSDAWDRIEQLRLQRSAAAADRISRLAMLDATLFPAGAAGAAFTYGLK
ncbi:MAG TPA: hypothetical protein VGS01_14080 [Candidatus Limnocylindria bacterium]|nr:hypothetical protein [Candidatus Limnocylindria bacterium]